jgi:addiction module HigA family antidote
VAVAGAEALDRIPAEAVIRAEDPGIEQHCPGEILRTEFLDPLKVSLTCLAHAMQVPPRCVNEIVLGKRAVTADTAGRFSRAFGTSALFLCRTR